MRIKDLHLSNDKSTWMWRTVEGDKGLYFTYANKKGMIYYSDKTQEKLKIATFEKFQACKTASGTRKKLNRFFADWTDDPFE